MDELHDRGRLAVVPVRELVKGNTSSVVFVGDDDQSLYRFRGATVELFTNFQQRFAAGAALICSRAEASLVSSFRPPIAGRISSNSALSGTRQTGLTGIVGQYQLNL